MATWLETFFSAQQVDKGGLIRRQRGEGPNDVTDARLIEVIAEAKRRNFHVVQTGNQVVVFCHGGDLRIWA